MIATGQPNKLISNQCTAAAITAGNPTANDQVVHAKREWPASKVWLIQLTHTRTVPCTQLPRTKGRACSINKASSKERKLMFG
jgi:hypothetical protein